MRQRLFIIVAIASLAGLLASYLVYSVVVQLQAKAPEVGNQPVVVAAVNMGLAETITKDHVKVVPWPKGSIPPGALPPRCRDAAASCRCWFQRDSAP